MRRQGIRRVGIAAAAAVIASCGAPGDSPGPLRQELAATAGRARVQASGSRPDLAIRTWRSAIDRALRLDDRLSQAISRSNLAAVYLDLGEVDLALAELDRAVAILVPAVEPEGHARGEAALPTEAARGALIRARIHGASAHLVQGDVDAAAEALEEARHLAGSDPTPALEAALLGVVGKIARRQGDPAAARRAFDRALEAARRVKEAREREAARAAALSNLADLALEEGDARGAYERFGEALDLDRHREGIVAMAWDLEGMGRAAEVLAQTPQGLAFLYPGGPPANPEDAWHHAARLYERAYGVASGAGVGPAAAAAAGALAKLFDRLGDGEAAQVWRERREAVAPRAR